MKRLLLAGALPLLAIIAVGQSAPHVKTDRLPRFRGAVLLVGDAPRNLFLATENNTLTLQDDKDDSGYISPTISANGKIVAAAHRLPGSPVTRGAQKRMVSTYSAKEQIWTDHGLLVYSGVVAISPDGSLLACEIEEAQPETTPGLRILNIHTGTVDEVRITRSIRSGISWSPDSRFIAVDSNWEPPRSELNRHPVQRSVFVLEVATGSISRIASGMASSWAPSGKWIAFVEETAGIGHDDFHLKVMRPDGTGARVVMKFESLVFPILKPVWSPDSQTLLLNVSRDPDIDTWDIYKVDLQSLKSTRIVKNTTAHVYGWVAVE